MAISASEALAVELHAHSPTHWAATYYPMIQTPAGRWADVTWALHQSLISATHDQPESARWLEVRSPDPDHPCYANHQEWGEDLAAGYVTALATHDAEDMEDPLADQDAQLLRENAVVIPAGQLSEWILDDLKDETSGIHG